MSSEFDPGGGGGEGEGARLYIKWEPLALVFLILFFKMERGYFYVLLSPNYYRRILRGYCIMYYIAGHISFDLFIEMVRDVLDEMEKIWSHDVVMSIYQSVLNNIPYLGDTAKYPIIID